jgi:hypothetical protein
MTDNVINFGRFKVINGCENEQEECCPDCQIRFDIVQDELTNIVEALNNSDDNDECVDALIDILHEYYDEIYREGQRSAFASIAEMAQVNVDHIDGVIGD